MSELKDMSEKTTDYIVIGFSRPKHPTIISRGIRFVEKTPHYSHVYIKARANSLDRTLVYHASESNLHFMSFDAFESKNYVYEEFGFSVSADVKKSVLQFCIDKAGNHYGRIQFFGMGLTRLAKAWFNIKISNPFRDGDFTMVCSELAGWVLRLLGVSFDTKVLESEGPRFIYSLCVDAHQRGFCERYTRE